MGGRRDAIVRARKRDPRIPNVMSPRSLAMIAEEFIERFY